MALPVLHFRAGGLDQDAAFERWRALIAPIYRVDRATGAGTPPMGEVSAFLLGSIIANRTIFDAQYVSRDKSLVDRSPDHIVFQLWRSGGFNGEVAGRSMSYGGGRVRLFDCRYVLAGRFTRSDTLGFTIPRALIEGIDLERIAPMLDERRNRLAAAQILKIYSRLAGMDPADGQRATRDVLAFLRRLLDPSCASDVLLGAELDESLLTLAEESILAHIGSDKLAPDFIAEQVGVSRATLYRLFAPLGGVMRYVAEQRLLMTRDMLSDPLERRSMTKIAEDYGFGSLAVFSRKFRGRFGRSPREWRQDHAIHTPTPAVAIGPLNNWWFNLGRSERTRSLLDRSAG